MSEQQINIPGLDVILVRGDDAKKFLQGQITNDIYLLDKEDKAIYAGYCNPKGRLIAFFLIIKNWNPKLHGEKCRLRRRAKGYYVWRVCSRHSVCKL